MRGRRISRAVAPGGRWGADLAPAALGGLRFLAHDRARFHSLQFLGSLTLPASAIFPQTNASPRNRIDIALPGAVRPADGSSSARLGRPTARGTIESGAAVGRWRIGMGHDARVAIIGLGYVGLPLAIAFVEAGLEVDRRRCQRRPGGGAARRDARRSTTSTTSGSAPRSTRASGSSRRTSGRLADADAIFVCVPTPITDVEGSRSRPGPAPRS